MKTIKPRIHQQNVLDDNSRIRVVVGGRRTGKSNLILLDCLNHYKSIILSFDSPMSKNYVNHLRGLGFDWKRHLFGQELSKGNKTIYLLTSLKEFVIWKHSSKIDILYLDESSWISLDEDKYIEALKTINPKMKMLLVGTPTPGRNNRMKRTINMADSSVYHFGPYLASGFTPEVDRNLKAYLSPSVYASEILGVLL